MTSQAVNENEEKLLEVKNVKVHYPIKSEGSFFKKSVVKAVDDVSFDIYKGETLGLVGESGSGKSSLGRAIVGLEKLTDGDILFQGQSLNYRKDRFMLSKQIQIVFQDPYATLNPRLTIGSLLSEPLIVHRIVEHNEVEKRVDYLLDLVGLPSSSKYLHPHEFSGGQRQRIGIARAIALNPSFIVCDEPVSALDVSIQAQILNLFKHLKTELGLTYLFIAHGLGAVKYISDRIAVMYQGKIVEIGTTEDIFLRPQHDYTRQLLEAYPVPNPRKRKLIKNESK